MSHINMAGLNGGGGTLGGMPLMNNGANGATPRIGNDNEQPDYEARLHHFIYDYFLKNENWECARALITSGLAMDPPPRPSDSDVNGVAEGSMHTDSKDGMDSKRPSDLPSAGSQPDQQGNSFLLEWFALFWDVYFAQKKNVRATPHANLYVQHSQAQSKMRQEQQQALLRGVPGMMGTAGMNYEQMIRMQNGMQQINGKDLQRQAQLNRGFLGQPGQAQMAAQLQMAKNQQIMQQQMRRDPSDVDINGQRPRTPSSAENAPSPPKRPRLENVPPQMMANPRGPSQFQAHMMDVNQAANANNMLMQGGINPVSLSEQQFAAFQQQNPQVQQKSIQVYAQNLAKNQQRQSMSKPGMQGHGSPMMQPGLELGGSVGPEFYNNQAMGMARGVPSANPAGGNHALQDYQMQLMLLEQQNKKRLLMARQEQDTGGRPDGQPGMPGAPGFAPGMSPSGSRSGPSPGPNDQVRGTPKMGKAGLPGSPMPDGSMPQQRGSPAAMNFTNGQMPEVFQQVKGMNDPNGNIMRPPPPSSHPQFAGPHYNPQQMEAMARVQPQGRIPNGNWPQGPPGQAPMIQQPPQPQQPAQMGTPQQRNDMPPPQAVPAGAPGNGRPSSPNQPAAPPTPNQSNKANPKGKKEKETRKRPKKTSTTGPTAATPSSEAENPPPTPTPSTPITPKNRDSFTNHQKNDAQNNQAVSIIQGGPTSATPSQVAPPQPDANHFDMMDPPNAAGFDMGYASLEQDNVLENFDFDSFLQSTDDGFNFDPSTLGFATDNGVEAGAGDV